MLEMDAYDEPDQDSDLDYEETYSKRTKRRKGSGRVRYLLSYAILHLNVFDYFRDEVVAILQVHLAVEKVVDEAEKKRRLTISNRHQAILTNHLHANVSIRNTSSQFR